jgi:hypothetical protein
MLQSVGTTLNPISTGAKRSTSALAGSISVPILRSAAGTIHQHRPFRWLIEQPSSLHRYLYANASPVTFADGGSSPCGSDDLGGNLRPSSEHRDDSDRLGGRSPPASCMSGSGNRFLRWDTQAAQMGVEFVGAILKRTQNGSGGGECDGSLRRAAIYLGRRGRLVCNPASFTIGDSTMFTP